MTSGGRRRPNGAKTHAATPRGPPRPTPGQKQLPGPLRSHDYILNEFNRVPVKEQWVANPKAPLSNYLGGGGGGASIEGSVFKSEEGMVDGKKVFR